jgi:hypothetical protein
VCQHRCMRQPCCLSNAKVLTEIRVNLYYQLSAAVVFTLQSLLWWLFWYNADGRAMWVSGTDRSQSLNPLCASFGGAAGGCVAHAARAAYAADAAGAARTVQAQATLPAAQMHGCTHAIAGLHCGAPLHPGCSRQWSAACCRAAGGCRARMQADAHQQLAEQLAAVRASRRASQECDDRQQQRRQQSCVGPACNDGPLGQAQLAAKAVATRAAEAAVLKLIQAPCRKLSTFCSVVARELAVRSARRRLHLTPHSPSSQLVMHACRTACGASCGPRLPGFAAQSLTSFSLLAL